MQNLKNYLLISFLVLAFFGCNNSEKTKETNEFVFAEADGILAIEAEHFFKQSHSTKRRWYFTNENKIPQVGRDDDEAHLENCSNGTYLEILPDTRVTHGDKLIHGENFSNDPGVLAILYYKAHFTNTGKYWVWVRAYSTGTEDNGIHVGLNGEWPASGQRMQWCDGKNTWRWESKQRTTEIHCGVPYKLFIEVNEPGEHTITFSMREDGFEFDKFLFTKDSTYVPKDFGPDVKLHKGSIPATLFFANKN